MKNILIMLLFATVCMFLISSRTPCSKFTADPKSLVEVYYGTRRFYDKDLGVYCYVRESQGISCLQLTNSCQAPK